MIGETLLHYRLIAKLGEGGMATVYRAQDTRLGRIVALKVLAASTSNDPKRRQRFLREARAAAALSHPNIVSIYEIGSEREIDFIAMELVEGQALSKLLRRGPLPIPETLSYAAQISSALAKAHSCGVVHRDLKPSNSMVTAEGFVKLLDFGLAQINPFVVSDGVQTPSSAETVSAITESGAVLGTYAYMSPEQARGEILDPRTDMFSFGIMLYEMLSGVRPFIAGNTVELLHKTMYAEPKPIRELRADTPAALLEIVAKCLAKHRDARFPSMDPVAESLRAMDRALDSNPVGQAALPLKTPRNWKFYAGTAAAVTVVGVGLAISPAGRVFRGTLPSSTSLPSEAAELSREGYAYLVRFDRPGNADKAVEAFQKTLTLQRGTLDAAAAYAGLGLAYAQKYADNPDPQWLRLARANAEQAVQLNGILADSHVSLGKVHLVGKNNSEAEKEFRRALDLEPKNVNAALNLGDAFARQRRRGEAEAIYQKLIAEHPGDWRAYHYLGGLLYDGGKYAEAVTAFEKASALAPDNIAVYKILGAAYHMLDRDADAVGVFQKALQIHSSSSILSNLGTVYFYMGRYQDAAEAHGKALEKGANNYRSWGNLAAARRFSGDDAKAKEAYREGIRLLDQQLATAPEDIRLHATLAYYLAADKQKERALKEVDRVRSFAKPDAESLFLIGAASELSGQRKKALQILSQSIEAGYALRQIQIHPDLVALRTDPGYHLILLAKAKK